MAKPREVLQRERFVAEQRFELADLHRLFLLHDAETLAMVW